MPAVTLKGRIEHLEGVLHTSADSIDDLETDLARVETERDNLQGAVNSLLSLARRVYTGGDHDEIVADAIIAISQCEHLERKVEDNVKS